MSRARRISPISVRSVRARARRGFTLVELLVAMVAGLMVALAVVSLSKEATNTFHEETRVAAAEMQLRTAMDRLRADLQRVAYMSTGNIWIDPTIGTTPGHAAPVSPISLSSFSNASHMSLYTLAGVRLFAGGSASASTMPLAAANGLSPDALEIAGSFSTVEQFAVGGSQSSVSILENGGCNNQGQRVFLDVNSSPAIWRLVGLANGTGANDAGGVTDAGGQSAYAQALLDAFQPVNAGAAGGSGDGGSATYPAFIVRYVDPAGRAQYVATCSGAPAAGWLTNGGPYIDLNRSTRILSPAELDNPSFAGPGPFPLTGGTINAVQIVRWEIQPSTMQDPLQTDSSKYDLTRTYLDASGAVAGSPEVVAEYAADLRFAFSVDTTSDNTGNYVGGDAGGASGTLTEVVYAFETAGSANANVASAVSLTPNPGPQRIRSIRARIATRAAIPDRTTTIGDAGLFTPSRYCANALADGGASCTPGTPSWSRTRTAITEVSLPNQARFWF